jgi:sporulation protein YlmC with PRC-barrel domain
MSVTVRQNTATGKYQVYEEGQGVLFSGATKEDAEGWAAEYTARDGGAYAHGEPVHELEPTDDLPHVETTRLISAAKVEGTAVYDTDGQKLGTIKSVMIEKVGGQVSYAVLAMGGFLGLGERYHAVPWSALDYDTKIGGYQIAYAQDVLKGAPTLSSTELEKLDDPDYERDLYGYYDDKPYSKRTAAA